MAFSKLCFECIVFFLGYDWNTSSGILKMEKGEWNMLVSGVNVLREIPERCLKGIANGELTLDGGVVRDTQGKIRAILRAANPDGLESCARGLASVIDNGAAQAGLQRAMVALQSCAQASLYLQGINLVVSLVGFAVIGSKLNKISRQLEQLDQKISLVLTNQMRQIWEAELQRRAEIRANIENLASGIRTGDRERTGLALNELTKSAVFYQMLSESLLDDIDVTKNNFDVLGEALRYAVSIRLAIVQTHAHRGDYSEALAQTKLVQDWQDNVYAHFARLQSEAGMKYTSDLPMPVLAASSVVLGPLLMASALGILAKNSLNQGTTQGNNQQLEERTKSELANATEAVVQNAWQKLTESIKKVPNVSPEWSHFISSQASVSQAIEYTTGQLEFCRSNALSWQDFASSLSSEEPFAYLEAA